MDDDINFKLLIEEERAILHEYADLYGRGDPRTLHQSHKLDKVLNEYTSWKIRRKPTIE